MCICVYNTVYVYMCVHAFIIYTFMCVPMCMYIQYVPLSLVFRFCVIPRKQNPKSSTSLPLHCWDRLVRRAATLTGGGWETNLNFTVIFGWRQRAWRHHFSMGGWFNKDNSKPRWSIWGCLLLTDSDRLYQWTDSKYQGTIFAYEITEVCILTLFLSWWRKNHGNKTNQYSWRNFWLKTEFQVSACWPKGVGIGAPARFAPLPYREWLPYKWIFHCHGKSLEPRKKPWLVGLYRGLYYPVI